MAVCNWCGKLSACTDPSRCEGFALRELVGFAKTVGHISEDDGLFFDEKCDAIEALLGPQDGVRFFKLLAATLQGSYDRGWFDAGGS